MLWNSNMDGLVSFIRQRHLQNSSYRQASRNIHRSQPPRRRSYTKSLSPDSRPTAKTNASSYQTRFESSIGGDLISQGKGIKAARRSLMCKTVSASSMSRSSTSQRRRRSTYTESNLNAGRNTSSRIDQLLRQLLQKTQKSRPMWTVYRKSPAALFFH